MVNVSVVLFVDMVRDELAHARRVTPMTDQTVQRSDVVNKDVRPKLPVTVLNTTSSGRQGLTEYLLSHPRYVVTGKCVKVVNLPTASDR